MNVFDVLNKLKWAGKLKDCEITILHRGAEGDRKVIKGGKVSLLKKHHFCYRNGEETFIPLHRVLEVRMKGRLLWKSRKNGQ